MNRMTKITIGLTAVTAAFASAHTVQAAAPVPAEKPVIVLVHGAFADGSSWSKVIPILQKDGYTVIAVQNPLTSVADDVATTKRVIDAQKGPVVAVGHSYGGVVITGAADGAANVKALVYLAAYAPDAGEPLGVLNDKFGPSQLATALAPDAAGFLYVDRAKFHEVFCKDVPDTEASIMWATQKPLAAATFQQSVTGAAWKTIPSWYLVSSDDHAINPDLERFMAQRIGAKTSEIKASHVAFISHPKEIAKLIEEAATSPLK
ncbi:alpha/beta hydrolase [Capsulimonas corticalis]|uniref:Alpha/beta hydrolase n=1 Tax=Capsulimonas corticalis TaxID=2219043 RepID=A0A402CVN0_9BACT|nr:alpha/beta hydrolase [Capsulimonas corticalis]BDI30451.1 alpha/beta hydrolase [Capsulimonas corticalis]